MDKRKILWAAAVLCALVGIGYFFFPADFINDLIPVIGMLDDLAINLITLTGVVVSVLGAIGIGRQPAEATTWVDESEMYGDYYEE